MTLIPNAARSRAAARVNASSAALGVLCGLIEA